MGGMHIAIDVAPGEIIDWFAGIPESERARKAVGDCPHDCPHNMTAVVAWGADLAHYELVRCDVEDGCNRDCRTWVSAAASRSYKLYQLLGWKLLSPAT